MGSSSANAPSTIDAAGITEQYGVSRSRLSEWHRDRDETGFPAARKEGRKQVWDAGEVAAWFADRTTDADRKREERTAALSSGDPEELLSAPEVARLLGYQAGASVIHHYLHTRPNYFPEPDKRGAVSMPGRGRPPEMHWKRRTILEWVTGRSGKGNRAAGTTGSDLQPVSAEGDPDELLAAPQAAYLLGYNSTSSFSSALAQGRLPSLKEGDSRQAGARGGPRRMWKRSTLLAVAAGRPQSRAGIPSDTEVGPDAG